MRILHLAFEDHRRPGSGGGSLRNREINSRLAAQGHDIDVVTANYPGAEPRLEDGVSYRQRGLRRGYAPSLLSHQACLPGIVRRARRQPAVDLIVEEFAPLTSSLGVGHWTGIPTIGVAQGFFAEQKAHEYHLPKSVLTGIQRWGARSHSQLIAVSEDVAARLRAEAPDAQVTVIANGVDIGAAEAAREWAATNPMDPFVLFLGRLEIAQKGLDVLIEAMAAVPGETRLVLAGEGKDRAQIENDIRQRGLNGRVELLGAVHGRDKWRLLASAAVLALPSRYETFGISPLEAMACGTAVVASDLTCLRELIPATAGILVNPDDAQALTGAVNALLSDTERRQALADAGPAVAQRYSWDVIADAQGDVYRSTVERNQAWVAA